MSAHPTFRSRLLRAAPLAALVVACTPAVAAACSVCMSGREDENQLAFRLTTALLTFLPLGLIGGIVLYLRSRVRELARREADRPERALRPGSQRPARGAAAPGWSPGTAPGS